MHVLQTAGHTVTYNNFTYFHLYKVYKHVIAYMYIMQFLIIVTGFIETVPNRALEVMK